MDARLFRQVHQSPARLPQNASSQRNAQVLLRGFRQRNHNARLVAVRTEQRPLQAGHRLFGLIVQHATRLRQLMQDARTGRHRLE